VVARGDGNAHAFPEAAALAEARPETLRGLGFSGHKARAIVALARGVAEGRVDLERLSDLDDATAVARLEDLEGVGRWTAEYVLLRGLGRLHVFPGDDVGARTALRRWLHRRTALDYAGVRRALTRWRGWGGLIYFHLLLDGLAARGEMVAVRRVVRGTSDEGRHPRPAVGQRQRRRARRIP
jgi:DNA-3-methyladenine glycosylase II